MEDTTILDLSNNKAQLMGTISQDATIFESNGEKFYEFLLEVPRLSGVVDEIPVTMAKNIADSYSINPSKGLKIALCGEFRSRNLQDEGKSHLILFFFVKEVSNKEQINQADINKISLTGYLCKAPVYRDTPFGRQICDILLAVNRAHNKKSDYIPCIIWGRNAVYIKNMPVGTKINLSGRIQSRVYNKQDENGNITKRKAYEISVNNFKVESAPSIAHEEEA